jgi:RNA binding exosome subunit
MLIVNHEFMMGKKNKNIIMLELSFNVHATEDEKKLLGILKKNFNIEESVFSKTVFEGYHGNPISKYTVIIKDALAQDIFEIIFKRLSSYDKTKLLDSISQNIDSSKALYIRLDKSSLFEDGFRVGESNTFHFKFKPKLRYIKDASDLFRKLILSFNAGNGNL